ncbi:MAG: pilin [Planctomycetes bacterium]|jgi:hypothetical protein|nr:pilin [Planctomycetota bacterium]
MLKGENLQIRKFIAFSFLIAIILAIFIFPPLDAAASGIQDALDGLKQAATRGFDGTATKDDPKSVITSIPEAIGKVVGAGLALIGLVFFILMIYGGFTWMTARGNEQQVTKAKELILAAIIGLVIVLAAYAITAYLGEALFT